MTYFWSDWNRAVKFCLSSACSWSHVNPCQSRIRGWSCLHGLREDPIQGIPWLSRRLGGGGWYISTVMHVVLIVFMMYIFMEVWCLPNMRRVPVALYLTSSTNNSLLIPCVKLIPGKLGQWFVWDHHHVFYFWTPIIRVFLISWPNSASHNILFGPLEVSKNY